MRHTSNCRKKCEMEHGAKKPCGRSIPSSSINRTSEPKCRHLPKFWSTLFSNKCDHRHDAPKPLRSSYGLPFGWIQPTKRRAAHHTLGLSKYSPTRKERRKKKTWRNCKSARLFAFIPWRTPSSIVCLLLSSFSSQQMFSSLKISAYLTASQKYKIKPRGWSFYSRTSWMWSFKR
jgi:hypothetical protein